MSMRNTVRAATVTAMALGLLAVGATGTSAQTAPVTLEIHKAECWTGVGATIFEDCHDEVLSGVTFGVWIDGQEVDFITTGADGVAALDIYAGELYIEEDPDVSGDYVGAYVFCSDLTTDEVLVDGGVDPDGEFYGVVVGEIEAGAEIVCDWYNLWEPADDGGSSGGVTTPPATGSGIAAGGAPLGSMMVLGLVAMAGAVALRRRVA